MSRKNVADIHHDIYTTAAAWVTLIIKRKATIILYQVRVRTTGRLATYLVHQGSWCPGTFSALKFEIYGPRTHRSSNMRRTET
jgi:hypothetical protein